MKILLLNPWIYDFAAYDLWVRPVALLKLSTYLKRKGHEIFFLDCLDRFSLPKTHNDKYECGKYYKECIEKPKKLEYVPRDYFRYGMPYNQVCKKLKSLARPNKIYINSMMTYWYPAVFDMVKLCREIFGDIEIEIGGVYKELMSEHVSDTCTNMFTFTNTITGLQYERQDRSLLSNKKVHILQTSFGCPFKCTYCASKIIHPEFIQRDVDDVVDEILYAHKTGAVHFVFYDDALLVNADKHIKLILKKVIEKKIDVKWHTPNGLHARYLSYETAVLMKQSGFKTIRLSLETSDENLQKNTGNKVNAREFEEAVLNLKKAGFAPEEIEVYVMMGLLGQTKEQLYRDMLYVHKLGASVVLAAYSPVYGTKDYDNLVDKGIINKNEDPLLLNNTVFIYRLGWDIEKIRMARRTASVLNYAVKQSIIIDQLGDSYVSKKTSYSG